MVSTFPLRATLISACLLAATFVLVLVFCGSRGPAVGRVLWEIRLPEAITALLAGGALGLSGLLMQTVLKNSLADPFMLGVAGGASLGAVLAAALAGAWLWSPSALPLRAAAALAFGYIAARLLFRVCGGAAYSLLLGGIVLNMLCAASARVLTSWLSPSQVSFVTSFLMGYIPTPPLWAASLLAIPSAAVFARFSGSSRALDLLLTSDDEASSLGLDVGKLRRVALYWATFAASCVVCFTGLLGFVGLLAPHAAAILGARRHDSKLVLSFLMGALFLLAAHGFTKAVSGVVPVPVGAATTLAGVPFFVWLLARAGRGQQGC